MLSVPALAGFYTGNDIFQACSNNRNLIFGFCSNASSALAMAPAPRQPPALAASFAARSAESWDMPETARQQKITFGEMRESGVDRILIYCADYKCSHSIEMSADRWPDHVRLSDIEPLFVCKACGKRGADVRGHFAPARMGTG
jgi:hypothetical protein